MEKKNNKVIAIDFSKKETELEKKIKASDDELLARALKQLIHSDDDGGRPFGK